MAVSTVSLRKSHDIVILSFLNIVKGQTTGPCAPKGRKYIGK